MGEKPKISRLDSRHLSFASWLARILSCKITPVTVSHQSVGSLGVIGSTAASARLLFVLLDVLGPQMQRDSLLRAVPVDARREGALVEILAPSMSEIWLLTLQIVTSCSLVCQKATKTPYSVVFHGFSRWYSPKIIGNAFAPSQSSERHRLAGVLWPLTSEMVSLSNKGHHQEELLEILNVVGHTWLNLNAQDCSSSFFALGFVTYWHFCKFFVLMYGLSYLGFFPFELWTQRQSNRVSALRTWSRKANLTKPGSWAAGCRLNSKHLGRACAGRRWAQAFPARPLHSSPELFAQRPGTSRQEIGGNS